MPKNALEKGEGKMKPIQPFKKVLRPGTAKDGDVFVKVEYDLTEDGDAERRKPRLSLSGVVGPYRNGNAEGGCGQINPVAMDRLAPGWTPAMLDRLWGTWKRWHLNDMRASCEHQRAEGWGEKELQLVTLRLKTEVLAKREAIEKAALKSLRETGAAAITEEERRVLCLEWSRVVPGGECCEGYAEELAKLLVEYEVGHREKKGSGWVRPDEHPEGVLCKPCPACGYKYGTAWLCKEVPAEVLEFLRGLPDSDVPCPWRSL